MLPSLFYFVDYMNGQGCPLYAVYSALVHCEINSDDFRWICQSSGSGAPAARRGLANPRHTPLPRRICQSDGSEI